MNKVTKLSDLKTGMLVKVRIGYEYIVMKDTMSGDIMLNAKGNGAYLRMCKYNEDMTRNKEHDQK